MIALIAVLVFVGVVTLSVGLWLGMDERRTVRHRLASVAAVVEGLDQPLLRERPPSGTWRSRLGGLAVADRLGELAEQAGRQDGGGRQLLLMGGFAAGGGVLAWVRTGWIGWAVVWGAVAGALPLLYLLHRRQQRVRRFEQQFPDGLDVMTRSLRAGHALGGAIQQVGETMADPVAGEFRRVAEEIRLGLEPGEALSRLQRRVPADDVRFFCTAVRIQRSAGGNLAEILDRLSEVIRDRFRLLSQARALAAQHKWSAVCVGLSPLAFAVLFGIVQPGYFTPLLESPLRHLLIGGGLALETIGFLAIWRIARIEV